MPARASIYKLPGRIKSLLDKKLVGGGFSDYSALAAWLKDNGFEISRSAIHRYGQKFEDKLMAIKIATEQAQAIAEAVGDEPGVLGDALTRLCQEKAFKVLVDMQDPDPGKADISKIGIMVARLNRAAIVQKKWMGEARQKAAAAAEEVVQVARLQGLSEETATEIRKKILGIV